MTRSIKRGGKVWIRLFPDKPITKKPAETRMGKGKGAPDQWVCVIRPGQDSVRDGRRGDATIAQQAMRLAAAKLPHADQARHAGARGVEHMKENAEKARALDTAEIRQAVARTAEQMFRLRFQMSMGQMDGLKKLRTLRKERARMLTVLRERELNPDQRPAGEGRAKAAKRKAEDEGSQAAKSGGERRRRAEVRKQRRSRKQPRNRRLRKKPAAKKACEEGE